MNLVCGLEGRASGVLLRAGEIIEGAELARAHRQSARKDRELAKARPPRHRPGRGPRLDGADACTAGGTPLRILTGAPSPVTGYAAAQDRCGR